MLRTVGLAVVVLVLVASRSAAAQQYVGPVQVRGSVGFSGEAYTTSGPNRRAPAALQVFANTSFNLFGLSSGFNLTYSTDQSRLRQNMNRLAFSTRWGWGQAAAGDVSPSLSRYTLSGTVLRGGYAELRPGPLYVSVGGGRANRATTAQEVIAGRGQAFERYVTGGRVGLGDKARSHLHLVAVYGRDMASSVDEILEVEPAENLVLAPEAGLLLWGERLFVRGAFAASAYTPDVRSPEGGPSFPLLTTRAGTSVDYSGEAGLRLRLSRGSLTLDASRFQPGYQTMGVPRFRADEQTVRGQLRLSLLPQSRLTLSAGGAHARDNLLGNKAVTVSRVTGTLDAAYRVSERLSVSGGAALLTTSSDPDAGTPDPERVELAFVSQSYRVAPVFTLDREGGVRHAIALSANYQTSEDRSRAARNGLRPSGRTDNLSGALTYTLGLPAGLSVTSSVNALRGETRTSRMDVVGVTVGSGLSFWERRLTLTGSVGASQNRSETFGAFAAGQTLHQYTGTLTAGYRLFGDDLLRLTLRALSTQTPDQTFGEGRAQLRYSHAF
jgi:hypothetical protein